MSQTAVSDQKAINHIAALDLGSNSFHLVVARIVAQDVQILHQLKLPVQIADGLDDDLILSDAAMARGLDALKVMAESLRGFEPDQVRIVGTYTLRRARNARAFAKAARKILPYPVEIISGMEEARLIYLGVAHTNHHDGRRMVVDIGAGSTEIALGEGFNPDYLLSLPMGCVTYTRRFFENGRIRAKNFSRAIREARQEIEPVVLALTGQDWQHCLGSSGTVRTIVDLAQRLGTHTPAGHVTLSDLHSLSRYLIDAGHVDKLDFENLSETRRPVLPAGLAIMIGVFESLDIRVLEYSAGALREGVIWEMEEQLEHKDIRERTAASLVTRYVIDEEQARRVEETTLSLYHKVKKDWEIDSAEFENILTWAARLHEVGLQINSKSVQKHSAYILASVAMPGFNQETQALLATLVRFQRKKIRPEEVEEFLLFESPDVCKLIALLRLGVLLNFKRQDELLPAKLRISASGESYTLNLGRRWLAGKPVFQTSLEREQNQISALGLTLNVTKN